MFIYLLLEQCLSRHRHMHMACDSKKDKTWAYIVIYYYNLYGL